MERIGQWPKAISIRKGGKKDEEQVVWFNEYTVGGDPADLRLRRG
jgi:hypothetical protein